MELIKMHKLSFKDNGLHLDDKHIYGIVGYDIEGHVDDFTTLKLELIVDDSEMFSKCPYEFTKDSSIITAVKNQKVKL